MIGQRLQQYVVLAKAGSGGMGVVWKARDTRLDRIAALKVLRPDRIEDPQQRERFFREAKSASALNHPNIITIYEINADHGVDFIAMEYVDGETLAARLQRGRLPLDEVLRIATQTADALGRAHRAGIVHRDLKPGNIMLAADGAVKVLDFGMAKLLQPKEFEAGSERATEAALTERGVRLGTIGYMSPEQAIGDVTDARSDVFSFGVILYEMLAGALPFTGRSTSETFRNLHLGDPPPLDVIRYDVPPWLLAIITKALAKSPEARFADMNEMSLAFRANAETATTLLDVSPRQRGWGTSPRIAVGVLLLASVAFGAFIVLRDRAPAGAAPDAVGSTGAASTLSPHQLSTEAATLLSRHDKEGHLDRAITMLEAALRQNPNYALAHANLSEAYYRKHRASPDPQWVRLAQESARQALTLNQDLAAAHLAQAFLDLDAGDRETAANGFRRAGELDPLSPRPHQGLAQYHALEKRDADAEAALRKAVELAPQDWRTHTELGQFFYRRSNYTAAISAWEEARRLTPDNVTVLRNLGAAYHFVGRYEEAVSSLQRAIEIQPAASIYANLGNIRFFQGRYNEAVAAFEKAVEGAANSYLHWGNLGDAYRWAPGRRQDAPAAYLRARDLLANELTKKPDDAELRTRNALYLIKGGDTDAAMKEIAAVAGREDLTPQMRFRIAVVNELAGNRGAALGALAEAVKSGYPSAEVAQEPELVALRADARYHRLVKAIRD